MSKDLCTARRSVAIPNDHGMHLRPASKFVEVARVFDSEIRVCSKGSMANGKSVLSLLGLAAERGTTLALEARGHDAEDAVATLADLVSAQFHVVDGRDGEI